MKIREVYNRLVRRHGRQPDSDWYFGPPDDAFIQILGFGPWRIERQERVHQTAKELARGRKLHQLDVDETLGYPLTWQQNYLQRMVKYLSDNNMTFSELASELRKMRGVEARELVRKILEVSTYSKVVSILIRDIINAHAFPVDRRVRRQLKKNNLPTDEDKIIEMAHKEGINERELNRLMYLEG